MSDHAGAPPRFHRFRIQWRQNLALMVVWVLLVGHVNLVSVLGGFLLGWMVTVVFPLPPVVYSGRLHVLGATRLVLRLLLDLAVASVSLVAFAFRRRPPRPGVIRVPLQSDSDLFQVMVAQLSSVVPGTIVLDARKRTRTLYLHVFDLPDDASVAHHVATTQAIEERVVEAFGSADEIAAFREARASRRPRRRPRWEGES